MSERERKEEGKRHQESDTNRGRKKRNREIYIEIYRKKKMERAIVMRSIPSTALYFSWISTILGGPGSPMALRGTEGFSSLNSTHGTYLRW